MRAGRGSLLLGALAAVLGAAACRPEVQYNPEGRGSAIDAIDVRGTVEIAAPRGVGAVRNAAVRPKVVGAPDGWHPESFLEGVVAAKTARG